MMTQLAMTSTRYTPNELNSTGLTLRRIVSMACTVRETRPIKTTICRKLRLNGMRMKL
ncbi:MAG: hypothetical protein ACD_75C01775G0001 [uncultured bacterium]|nr:MAG: hypothetical protein ACD_75C01775G0001 [uncultured bacterium]